MSLKSQGVFAGFSRTFQLEKPVIGRGFVRGEEIGRGGASLVVVRAARELAEIRFAIELPTGEMRLHFQWHGITEME